MTGAVALENLCIRTILFNNKLTKSLVADLLTRRTSFVSIKARLVRQQDSYNPARTYNAESFLIGGIKGANLGSRCGA